MNEFEFHYNNLIDYSQRLIWKNGLNSVDSSEIVSEAYIKFSESKKEFDINDFRLIISGIINAAKRKYSPIVDVNAQRKLHSTIEHIRCKKCNEIKPTNAFPCENRSGVIIVRHRCIECRNEVLRQKRKINPAKSYYKYKPVLVRKKTGRKRKHHYPPGTTLQQKKNKGFKIWVAKNRERWNAYMRERNKKNGGSGLTRKEYDKQRKEKAKPLRILQAEASKRYQQKQREILSDKYIRHLLQCAKKPFTPDAIIEKRKLVEEKRRSKAKA